MNIVFTHTDGQRMTVEGVAPPHIPLQGVALVATLNAVLGLWSLQDAANLAQMSEQALISEAQAWAVASEQK